MAKFNVCFVLGGPGVGKGTVCSQIVEEYGYTHLSAGELLRQARDSPSSKYATVIQTHMLNGTIVPAKITCGLLHEAMIKASQERGCVDFLVDGFPRNEDNRACWESELGDVVNLKRVIVLVCSDEICIQRCIGRCSGRVDDNMETLTKRLRQFKEQCMPIIEYFDQRNLVTRIDGSKSKEEVFAQVKQLMSSLGF